MRVSEICVKRIRVNQGLGVNALYEVFSGIFDHPIGIWLMGPIVTLCFDEE